MSVFQKNKTKRKAHVPLFWVPAGKNCEVPVVPHVIPRDVVLLCRQRHGLHTLLQTQHTEKTHFKTLTTQLGNRGAAELTCVHALSHVGLEEQVQQHPLSSDLGKVQRLVQSVPESDELGDLLKRTVLVRLDDVLRSLVREAETGGGLLRRKNTRENVAASLTSFWLEWKNLREKLQDWEAAAN